MTRLALVLAGVLLTGPAVAVETDRLAVEVLAGESPREAAVAYERACWRLGARLGGLLAVATVHLADATFVRLHVVGDSAALACLNALEPPRRAIDGTISWFDGFAGGVLEPSGDPPQRLADALWYDLSAPAPTADVVDRALSARLVSGDAEAFVSLGQLGLEAALLQVDALAARASPAALAALETIVKQHPHLRVRRAAVDALDPSISFETLAAVAEKDAAWEVRMGAVERLGIAAQAPLAGAGPHSEEAGRRLVALAASDAAWEVRRLALWQLPSLLVNESRDEIAKLLANDPEDRVRAVALETLAGADALSTRDLRIRLKDRAPGVRAVAANMLVAQMEKQDAPALWVAMNDPDRLVRLASARLVDRIDDQTIAPALWWLYVREAEELDADPDYQRALLGALARHPSVQLPMQIVQRMQDPLAPLERRMLAMLLAKIAPEVAFALFGPLLASANPRERALAAEVLPDSSSTRARRLALLTDADAQVTAAAVIGLCRAGDPSLRKAAARATLPLDGLGPAAASALADCGDASPEPPRLVTRLLSPEEEPVGEEASFWTAIAAISMLLVSVIAIKLKQNPPEEEVNPPTPADGGPPPEA